jgi:hypothetical protein
VSLSSGDEVPHIFTPKSRLRPGEFFITRAKRVLQHIPPDSGHHRKAVVVEVIVHSVFVNGRRHRFQRLVQALKSSSLTLGSFLTKATMVQISWSGTSIAPKLGMPVMLIPFLITQNNCSGARSLAISLRSGGSGCSPSENLAHLTPGPP